MARDIVAIDVHVHLSDEFTQKAKGDRTAQMAKYFGRERPPVSIDEMAGGQPVGRNVDLKARLVDPIEQRRREFTRGGRLNHGRSFL